MHPHPYTFLYEGTLRTIERTHPDTPYISQPVLHSRWRVTRESGGVAQYHSNGGEGGIIVLQHQGVVYYTTNRKY